VNALQEKYLMRASFLTLSLCLLVIVSPSDAQFEHFYENWRWAHFTTKTGLPSNAVEEIIETDDGTVWVSTTKGIAWYDGYRWNHVVVDSQFPEQHVRKIEPYYGGKIFALLSGALYIGNKHEFLKINLPHYSETGTIKSVCTIDSVSYYCIYENADSAYLLKIKKESVTIVKSPSPHKLFKAESTIWFLAEGEDGYNGIYKLQEDSSIQVISQLIRPNAIRNIVENKKGCGLFAIDAPKQNIGLWEYDENKKIKYSNSERNQPIRTVDISETGEIIVVYESGEIHLSKAGIWSNISPLPKQMLNIMTVRYRANDDLWLGTEDGLYLFNRQQNLWSKNNSPFSDLKNVVMDIFQRRNGDVWVGTMNGIEVLKRNGKNLAITNIDGRLIGLVTGINEDINNHMWISTGAGFKGAYEWNGKQWYWHSIDSNKINYHKIRKDNSGRLWFLGLGENRHDPAGYILSDHKWLKIDSIYDLKNNRLYAFCESKSGTKWFGTNNGLTRVKEGKTRHWRKESLGKSSKVYTLTVDDNDNVWFSTFSPQLGKITVNDSLIWIWKDDEVFNYRQKVWDLSFDSTGVLWAATTRGLFRCFNSTWSNYSYETGMYIRELRVVLPTGEKIFVGGHGIGLRSIDRRQIGSPIKIFILKPIIESNDMYCSWEATSYWGSIPSEQIETRYKLNSGLWSNWSTQSDVVLKSLHSGLHILNVQAKDSYGNIYDENNVVSFRIEPPIMYRPAYLIPFVIMLSIVGITLVRYQKAQHTNKKLIQNQRTRIANDLHDEVGSNLGSIALISQRIGRSESIAQTIKDDLAIITETTLQTSEFLRDIVWYINPRYDTFMNLEARLREISGRMLRDMDVRVFMADNVKQDDKFIEGRRNIILMFKEILHNILKHARATKVEIHCDSNPNMFVLSVKDNGVGFNQEMSFNGSGLLSLKRRTQEVGAKLKIISQKGEGTEVIIIFQTNANTL